MHTISADTQGLPMCTDPPCPKASIGTKDKREPRVQSGRFQTARWRAQYASSLASVPSWAVGSQLMAVSSMSKGIRGNHRPCRQAHQCQHCPLSAQWAKGKVNISSQVDWPPAALKPLSEDHPDTPNGKVNREGGFCWHWHSELLNTWYFHFISFHLKVPWEVSFRFILWMIKLRLRKESYLPKVTQPESLTSRWDLCITQYLNPIFQSSYNQSINIHWVHIGARY